jgi:choline-glycine betaine transporter
MDKNTTKIDHAIANGYSVDLGTVIEKAFENYKKIALLGGLAYLLIVLAIVGIGSALAVTMLGINDFTETLTNIDPTKFTAVGIIIYVLGMVIISGLASPINAGFFKMAHLAEHNKEFSIGTIFDYYKTA